MSISPQWKEVEKMLLHFGADTGLSGACWPKWRRESLSPWKINPPRKYFCFRFGWWSSNFSWSISKYIKIYLAITCHHDLYNNHWNTNTTTKCTHTDSVQNKERNTKLGAWATTLQSTSHLVLLILHCLWS